MRAFWMSILCLTAGVSVARASAPAACVRLGDHISVQGRIATGKLVRDDDPGRATVKYVYIVFDPALHLCSGATVGRAAYVDPSLPAPDAPDRSHTISGDLEAESTGTAESYSFAAD